MEQKQQSEPEQQHGTEAVEGENQHSTDAGGATA